MTKVERPFTHAVCGTHAISLKGPVILRPRGADHPACMPPIMLTVQPARRPRVAPHAENSVRVLVSSQARGPCAACRAEYPVLALRVEPSAWFTRRVSSRARGSRVGCRAQRPARALRVIQSAWPPRPKYNRNEREGSPVGLVCLNRGCLQGSASLRRIQRDPPARSTSASDISTGQAPGRHARVRADAR